MYHTTTTQYWPACKEAEHKNVEPSAPWLYKERIVCVSRFNLLKTIQRLPGDSFLAQALRGSDNEHEVRECIRAQYQDNPALMETIIPKHILMLILC